jgi:hypothetical protein
MIGKRTLIAISAAMALGVLGASAAQANDSGEDRGGFVVPGSMVGVNPVYHPDLFGGAGYASAARNAYGYAIAPVHKQRHEQTQGR